MRRLPGHDAGVPAQDVQLLIVWFAGVGEVPVKRRRAVFAGVEPRKGLVGSVAKPRDHSLGKGAIVSWILMDMGGTHQRLRGTPGRGLLRRGALEQHVRRIDLLQCRLRQGAPGRLGNDGAHHDLRHRQYRLSP